MDIKDKYHDDFRPPGGGSHSVYNASSRRTRLRVPTDVSDNDDHQRVSPHLGEVVGNPNASEDSPDAPRIELMFPDYFRVQRHVKVGTYECFAIGNRFLLSKPLRLQVQCSRSMTPEQIAETCDYYL